MGLFRVRGSGLQALFFNLHPEHCSPPHSIGLPKRSRLLRELKLDHADGMVEIRPLPLRSSERSPVSAVQEAGKAPPSDGFLYRGGGVGFNPA